MYFYIIILNFIYSNFIIFKHFQTSNRGVAFHVQICKTMAAHKNLKFLPTFHIRNHFSHGNNVLSSGSATPRLPVTNHRRTYPNTYCGQNFGRHFLLFQKF